MSETATNEVALASGQHGRGAVVVLPGQTPEGGHILSVLLKRSYGIVRDGRASRAETDRPLVAGDQPWGNPLNSTTRYEADFVPFKLGTDVVFDALAHAPGGTPAPNVLVGARVAGRQKVLQVFGNRSARLGERGILVFDDPVPFETMAIRYEFAYGGIDVFSDKRVAYPYPRNPLGRGFAIAPLPEVIDNLDLPNIEDPADLLTPERLCIGEYAQWEGQPMPAGLGWFPKTSVPRARFAGVMPADQPLEQELRQAYAKLVPAGQREAYVKNALPTMDFRFFSGASPGLCMPYLTGDERIETLNLSPEGRLNFFLPDDRPRIGLDIGGGRERLETVIQTVLVRMEEQQIDIVWRGALAYPGRDWLVHLRKMDILIQ
jgi:hypothetical protein